MSKPYIVCYMMTSVDGRIDCAMTEKLPGVEEIGRNENCIETVRRHGRIFDHCGHPWDAVVAR